MNTAPTDNRGKGRPKTQNELSDKRKRRWGSELKMLREAAGLTQEQLTKLVNQNYFTFISQVETGRARIPPADTELWARILGADTQHFAKKCVEAYECQEYFHAIYGEPPKNRP